MPRFQSFSARISVDGNALPEYGEAQAVGTDGVLTVSCWVASEAGKAFCVRWTDRRRPRSATSGALHIDGVDCGRRAIHPDHGPFRRGVSSARKDSVRSSPTERRTLIFAPLELTDEDDALAAGAPAALGEIALTITPVLIMGAAQSRGRVDAVALSSAKIHERSKKAGVHRVQLGVPRYEAHSRTPSRSTGPPHVRFVFRYRPLGLLQANGIVERAQPSSLAAPASSSPLSSQLSASARQGVKRERSPARQTRIQALEDELRLLRDNDDVDNVDNDGGEDEPSAGRVKREPPPLIDMTAFAQGEIIDLTSD